jgi:hypothetical protein
MKALRHGLTRWGNYLAHQKYGQGFACRSQCDKLGEVIVYGSSAVVEITPPLEVRQFDQMIERLTPQCIRAITTTYEKFRGLCCCFIGLISAIQFHLKNKPIKLMK